jgi:hypothetical protein
MNRSTGSSKDVSHLRQTAFIVFGASRKKAGYEGDLRIICYYALQFSCRGAESDSSEQMVWEMQKTSWFTSSGGCYVIVHIDSLYADCRNDF